MNYGSLRTATDRRKYFQEHGYVVYPRLLNAELCDRAVGMFRKEIKPYRGFIYRQASANPERHIFTSAGSMLNSLLNPVSVNGRLFPEFRKVSQELLSQDSLFSAVGEILGEPGAIVQSMYFEGNPATWAHQDCYYLDSDREGSMVAAWIALEDIAEEAGRFYVVPGSHKIQMPRNGNEFNIALNHDNYKALVLDVMAKHRLEMRSPALKKGDVLLWASRTIHGAFSPKSHAFTRNSYTAHFISSSTNLFQYQCIVKKINPSMINGHAIALIKDQNRSINRLAFLIERTFPTYVQKIKKKLVAWNIQSHISNLAH